MCIYMSKMVLVIFFARSGDSVAVLGPRLQSRIRWLVSYMPLVIFCAWHFCLVRPSWSSVGLLHRPLGYYIVRSPQLDERFGPALYWSR